MDYTYKKKFSFSEDSDVLTVSSGLTEGTYRVTFKQESGPGEGASGEDKAIKSIVLTRFFYKNIFI